TGLYTAPTTIASTTTVTATATSAADSTKTGTATITLYPPLVVTVGPSAATLYANQTEQFSATVTNAANAGVTWSITPATGAGSISATTGLYTAPATIGATQTVTVTAKSQADNSTL